MNDVPWGTLAMVGIFIILLIVAINSSFDHL